MLRNKKRKQLSPVILGLATVAMTRTRSVPRYLTFLACGTKDVGTECPWNVVARRTQKLSKGTHTHSTSKAKASPKSLCVTFLSQLELPHVGFASLVADVVVVVVN